MTGKDLKSLVRNIPDDAEVFITGPDFGGYDVCPCTVAVLTKSDSGFYEVHGFDSNTYRREERLLEFGVELIRTPLYPPYGEQRTGDETL